MITYQGRWLKSGEVWFDDKPVHKEVDILTYIQCDNPVNGADCRPFHTLLIDLSPSATELLATLSENTRYKIRRGAEKDGVKYRGWNSSPPEVMAAFSEFYDRFASQKGLGQLNRVYLNALEAAGVLDISCVTDKEGRDLVWHVHYRNRHRARLLYSASLFREVENSALRNLIGRANRYHHWQDMLRFKQAGIRVYDFGGWYQGTTDTEKLGINRFKAEFGGTVVTNYNCKLLLTAKSRLLVNAGKWLERAMEPRNGARM
ncbi:uncharacterized protein sS8_2891 [Methylocaldum marinum]|uniref:BioF2-like acetyltransferase domain-containing protein n=1 Tax=Methylocaldum marinum TaxID=1432792 RepID=A0A250KTH2_9GAMM|nr:uncharacterized protein sS8_2891 [Methylocaldum marinum]